MTLAKPVVVGGFVLGALAIAVLAILTFGSLHLFTHTLRVVAVFRDSIAGLDAGAPVTFRGIRVGHVEGMKLHIDLAHHASWIPVYLAIELDRIDWVNGPPGGTRADLRAAVDSGLRAQLVPQNLVSGQMSVNLDYYPEIRASRAGHPDNVFEIPTIPSDIQNLKDQLRSLDLPGISRKAQRTLTSMQHALEQIGGQIEPIASGLQGTLATTSVAVRSLQADAGRVATGIDQLTREGRSQIAVNGRDLDELLKTAQRAANQADRLVFSLNQMTSPNEDLQASLRDLAASASSLRSLTQDLERNPVGTLLRKEQ